MSVRFSITKQQAERGQPLSVAHGYMKRAASALTCVAMLVTSSAFAQGNNDDFTPLGSRIKRDRQFPLDLPHKFDRDQQSAVNRARSKSMLAEFTSCLYGRSKTASLDLLQKTDPSFVDFSQVKMENDRAMRIFGFQDCLSRVAESNNTGVVLRWSAQGLRQWLIQEAYFDKFREGPTWAKPGNVIAERTYVLQGQYGGVRVAMDFADCVVANDPNSADYYFRAAANSDAEKQALQSLTSVLGPCLRAGQRVTLDPSLLRVWLGEAPWYAAGHNAPAPADTNTSKVAP